MSTNEVTGHLRRAVEQNRKARRASGAAPRRATRPAEAAGTIPRRKFDAAAEREERKREYDALVAFVRDSMRTQTLATETPAATASQIIKAAETARRGGPDLPAPSGTAAEIVKAAKTAREGGPALPGATGTAAAIILAGKKASGEA